MDNKKIARELVKVAKSLIADDGAKDRIELDRQFGKVAVELVELEKLIRKIWDNPSDSAMKKIHNQVQDTIEALDGGMDDWEDYKDEN